MIGILDGKRIFSSFSLFDLDFSLIDDGNTLVAKMNTGQNNEKEISTAGDPLEMLRFAWGSLDWYTLLSGKSPKSLENLRNNLREAYRTVSSQILAMGLDNDPPVTQATTLEDLMNESMDFIRTHGTYLVDPVNKGDISITLSPDGQHYELKVGIVTYHLVVADVKSPAQLLFAVAKLLFGNTENWYSPDPHHPNKELKNPFHAEWKAKIERMIGKEILLLKRGEGADLTQIPVAFDMSNNSCGLSVQIVGQLQYAIFNLTNGTISFVNLNSEGEDTSVDNEGDRILMLRGQSDLVLKLHGTIEIPHQVPPYPSGTVPSRRFLGSWQRWNDNECKIVMVESAGGVPHLLLLTLHDADAPTRHITSEEWTLEKHLDAVARNEAPVWPVPYIRDAMNIKSSFLKPITNEVEIAPSTSLVEQIVSLGNDIHGALGRAVGVLPGATEASSPVEDALLNVLSPHLKRVGDAVMPDHGISGVEALSSSPAQAPPSTDIERSILSILENGLQPLVDIRDLHDALPASSLTDGALSLVKIVQNAVSSVAKTPDVLPATPAGPKTAEELWEGVATFFHSLKTLTTPQTNDKSVLEFAGIQDLELIKSPSGTSYDMMIAGHRIRSFDISSSNPTLPLLTLRTRLPDPTIDYDGRDVEDPEAKPLIRALSFEIDRIREQIVLDLIHRGRVHVNDVGWGLGELNADTFSHFEEFDPGPFPQRRKGIETYDVHLLDGRVFPVEFDFNTCTGEIIEARVISRGSSQPRGLHVVRSRTEAQSSVDTSAERGSVQGSPALDSSHIPGLMDLLKKIIDAVNDTGLGTNREVASPLTPFVNEAQWARVVDLIEELKPGLPPGHFLNSTFAKFEPLNNDVGAPNVLKVTWYEKQFVYNPADVSLSDALGDIGIHFFGFGWENVSGVGVEVPTYPLAHQFAIKADLLLKGGSIDSAQTVATRKGWILLVNKWGSSWPVWMKGPLAEAVYTAFREMGVYWGGFLFISGIVGVAFPLGWGGLVLALLGFVVNLFRFPLDHPNQGKDLGVLFPLIWNLRYAGAALILAFGGVFVGGLALVVLGLVRHVLYDAPRLAARDKILKRSLAGLHDVPSLRIELPSVQEEVVTVAGKFEPQTVSFGEEDVTFGGSVLEEVFYGDRSSTEMRALSLQLIGDRVSGASSGNRNKLMEKYEGSLGVLAAQRAGMSVEIPWSKALAPVLAIRGALGLTGTPRGVVLGLRFHQLVQTALMHPDDYPADRQLDSRAPVVVDISSLMDPKASDALKERIKANLAKISSKNNRARLIITANGGTKKNVEKMWRQWGLPIDFQRMTFLNPASISVNGMIDGVRLTDVLHRRHGHLFPNAPTSEEIRFSLMTDDMGRFVGLSPQQIMDLVLITLQATIQITRQQIEEGLKGAALTRIAA